MISRATMGTMTKAAPDGGKTPSKIKREKPTGNARVSGAVEGSGLSVSNKGVVSGKNVMGHGERCATASGHIAGKGG